MLYQKNLSLILKVYAAFQIPQNTDVRTPLPSSEKVIKIRLCFGFQQSQSHSGIQVIQHNTYFLHLKSAFIDIYLISAMHMAYLLSKKYTTVAALIKSLQFYYCVRSVPPSWFANSGYVRLLQLQSGKSKLRGRFTNNFQLGTHDFQLIQECTISIENITASVNGFPSIHPSIFLHLSGSGLWWQQSKARPPSPKVSREV